MQGKKDYQEKLFSSFQLSRQVPKNNFYRRLKEVLDLSFLYKETAGYYGCCGQKSIDPIVFYKLNEDKVENSNNKKPDMKGRVVGGIFHLSFTKTPVEGIMLYGKINDGDYDFQTSVRG